MTSYSEAEAAIAPLLGAEEDQLYAELGIRAKALSADPSTAGSFDPDVTYDAAEMGVMDDVRALGKKVFKRCNRELNGLVCGDDPDDAEDRAQLTSALGLGEPAVAAALAGLLVSSLGLAPAIAGVVAVIVVRRFFNPAMEQFCTAWTASLA